MSGTFKGAHSKAIYQLPKGAVARPARAGEPTLYVTGMTREQFVCGSCKGEAEFLMPERGPHRETPTIDYRDDPLRVPVCEACGRLLNCRNPRWDLEIRSRWEDAAMRHEAGQDVMASPTLLVISVPTDGTRMRWQ